MFVKSNKRQKTRFWVGELSEELIASENRIYNAPGASNYGSAEISEEDDMEVVTIKSNGTRWSKVPLSKFIWIESSLFLNVFLAGFDGTVTASTYTTIGNQFNSTDTASWITTSYLITSTAFQPLYGSFSDILGRRACLVGATFAFMAGCAGCALSTNIIMLDIMRALTGIGGGGLVTLATIINSDIIAPEMRGNWQAFQNLLLSFGGICGASFGGVVAESLGWRWCFLLQVPIALAGIIIGYYYVENQDSELSNNIKPKGLSNIDFSGAFTLVSSLTVQLLVLSLGGNQLGWSDYRLGGLFFLSGCLLLFFGYIEENTKASPIIPPILLQKPFSFIILGIGVFVGISSFAYLFVLPLLFQVVLGDSPSKAGLRLTIPSLFTPIGGLTTGYFMSKNSNSLFLLVLAGAFLMFVGNMLALQIYKGMNPWFLGLCLIPANIGQGMIYPSSLFSFIYSCDKDKHAIATSTAYLFRSIGSVWGVAGSAAIIQYVLKKVLANSLSKIPELKNKEISQIIQKVSKDVSLIDGLDEKVKVAVQAAYTIAIRKAQTLSCLFCFGCLLLCGMKYVFRIKSHSSYD